MTSAALPGRVRRRACCDGIGVTRCGSMAVL